jgi:hypothetical protein
MEVSGQLHAPASLPTGKEHPGILWIGGWVGPRAGLDAVAKRSLSSCREPSPPTKKLVEPLDFDLRANYTQGVNKALSACTPCESFYRFRNF